MSLITLLSIVVFAWADVPFNAHYTDSETEIHVKAESVWHIKTDAPGVIHIRVWTNIKQPVNASIYHNRVKVACTSWSEPSSYIELKYMYWPAKKPIKK